MGDEGVGEKCFSHFYPSSFIFLPFFISKKIKKGGSISSAYFNIRRLINMKKINGNDKIKFLRWFMRYHQPKRIETIWILNYIAHSAGMIENVHFVSDASLYERSLFISSKGTTTKGFIFRKGDFVFYDVEIAYKDLQEDMISPIYIQCHFPHAYQSEEYFSVLEDDTSKIHLSHQEQYKLDLFLEQSLFLHTKEQILREIDKSLDKKDKAYFLLLTEKLKEFDKKL